MSTSNSSVQCGSCGLALSDSADQPQADRAPCPKCGSQTRSFAVRIAESVTLREKRGMKLKRSGKGKPAFESVSGDDQYKKTGKWNKLDRVIDRENDRYKERIVDGDTGSTIRDVDEPLSEHQGRGAARRRPAGDA